MNIIEKNSAYVLYIWLMFFKCRWLFQFFVFRADIKLEKRSMLICCLYEWNITHSCWNLKKKFLNQFQRCSTFKCWSEKFFNILTTPISEFWKFWKFQKSVNEGNQKWLVYGNLFFFAVFYVGTKLLFWKRRSRQCFQFWKFSHQWDKVATKNMILFHVE